MLARMPSPLLFESMDHDPSTDHARRRSDVSFLERKIRGLTLRRTASETAVESIGDLGLNLLHEPPDCNVDFVFVHGLRGGSRKTWSASPSPAHYWPKEWLPADPDFRNVRIHSFGYNSDWLDNRENLLTIHDFGQSLIEEIYNTLGRGAANTPIVFIGHSMGGLVIKKACIISRENPVYNTVGARIHSIYFLATPHRGSDLAQTLSNMLKAMPSGPKPFVGSLARGSEAITVISDQFRHVLNGISIHSFMESVPTNWGFGSGLIVDKHSACLGYPDERVQTLNADHRGVCKFETPNDSNFRALRNALAATVENIERRMPKSRQQLYRQEMQSISRFLNVSSGPIDDLTELEDSRIPGSCEWVTSSKSFLDWQYGDNSPRYFWLTGKPAIGKSVITAHAIRCLDSSCCSYFFFKHGDHRRSSLSAALLSLAYQMAQNNHTIRQFLLEISSDDIFLDKDDYRGIWRRLFVGGIFLISFSTTYYWVLDALDECNIVEKRMFDNFFSMLGKIDHTLPLKVFVSSRSSVDLERFFSSLSYTQTRVSVEDSQHDIRIFVEAHADDLPVNDERMRAALIETMVKKSVGCFLWTVLVMRQLQDIYTADEIEDVLNEVPQEMDALYSRNLDIMASRPRTKKLALTVLAWTVCATRSLTVDELKSAILLDTGTAITRDLERSISTLCGQFVFVDRQNRVQIVHETARTFLLALDQSSGFQIQLPLGNVQLGLACFRYLTSDEMTARAKCRGSAINPLAEYACTSFSEHLVRATSSSDDLYLALLAFLDTKILVWIEKMAEQNNLSCLLKAAMHLKAYQARRSKHVASLQDVVSVWATDLPRIVTEFGVNLTHHPAAIYQLIPPLCPQSSGIHRQFGSTENGIRLRGISNSDWNDRISCWNYKKTAKCIACQDKWFAVGLADGMVHVHWTSTCQEFIMINHGETVRILRFGNLARTLVSAGIRLVKLWDVTTGSLLWEHRLDSDPLAMDFGDDDKTLVAATRSKKLLTWSTANGSLISQESWHHNLPHDCRHVIYRAPSAVAISSSQRLMAIVYRSLPLSIWDLESQRHLGFCIKTFDDGNDTSNNITSVCFNPVQTLNLLAVAYMDGDVAIFDTISRAMKCQAEVQTHILAVSGDGRTLAGGDSVGSIKLFDFETLQILYCVTLSSAGIGAIAFTADSLRLLELRGAQANVWEPSALVRKWDYADEDRSDFSSEVSAKTAQESGRYPEEEGEDITCIKATTVGDLVLSGKVNGSVVVFDLAPSIPSFQELYNHKGASITCLDFSPSGQTVASADNSGRFKVSRLSKDYCVTELLNCQLPYGQRINQILISSDETKILVSSSAADVIWAMDTANVIASRAIESQASRRWFQHPHDSTKIMLFGHSMLQVFSWDSPAALSPDIQTPIGMAEHSCLDLKRSVLQTKNNTLVVKLGLDDPTIQSHSSFGIEKTSLYTIDLSKTVPPLQPLPLFIFTDVKHLPSANILLGIAPGPFSGTLLVFIAFDGWICSIDMNHASPHSTFQRHFFVPSAWLSTSAKIISAVTSRKEILFVRGHEIAVISNGLDAAETIQMC
ncbi:hypothetical protein VTL71DRAFT_15551 [Oculimacula yallundae]|uniref:GPI inositol-deacylase n=1 Tax=Oculimacula yallundae TaxID=86028 RepID=A0ABR4CGX9_9HELO